MASLCDGWAVGLVQPLTQSMQMELKAGNQDPTLAPHPRGTTPPQKRPELLTFQVGHQSCFASPRGWRRESMDVHLVMRTRDWAGIRWKCLDLWCCSVAGGEVANPWC
jgi:hypothetical protein